MKDAPTINIAGGKEPRVSATVIRGMGAVSGSQTPDRIKAEAEKFRDKGI